MFCKFFLYANFTQPKIVSTSVQIVLPPTSPLDPYLTPTSPYDLCEPFQTFTKSRVSPRSRTWVHILALRWAQSQPLSAILSQQDSPPNVTGSGNQLLFNLLLVPLYESTRDTLHTRLSCSLLLSYKHSLLPSLISTSSNFPLAIPLTLP